MLLDVQSLLRVLGNPVQVFSSFQDAVKRVARRGGGGEMYMNMEKSKDLWHLELYFAFVCKL